MDRRTLVTNIVAVSRAAKLYDLPVVLSTVNVKTGRNEPTIHQLQEVLKDVESYDRTTINAWEDEDFLRAVKATGRRKLIMAALWTEACLTFPALDALKEGTKFTPSSMLWAVPRPKRTVQRWSASAKPAQGR
jgi:nicotinamidase-related amidase